jgi:uncharacterized membrane protein YjjP (DUF1212 family)
VSDESSNADRQPNSDAMARVEEVAHLSLQLGRLLLVNGASTEYVEMAILRFAAAFGCEAHLMVDSEAVLLTVVAGAHFTTKIGRRVPAMNVRMVVVEAVNRAIADAVEHRSGLAEIRAELDRIERRPPVYPRLLVVILFGLTAGSLARLFGGDWQTFAAAWVAGSAGTWLRQELGRRRFNPVFVTFAAAFAGGLVGAGAVLLGFSEDPALCLVAPGMIIVPGVPLINGVHDMIRNHVTLGISRLGFAGMIILTIAIGLFAATVVTGVTIPVSTPTLVLGVAEDAAFSALAAVGFAFFFDVPGRMVWACVVCGVASHTSRTLGLHLGIDVISGTLIGALIAGALSQIFARRLHAPAATFAFPGVVAMMPGSYAFRAVIGGLDLAHGSVAPGLATQTFSLGIIVVLLVLAIAIGVTAPVLLVPSAPPVGGEPRAPDHRPKTMPSSS